jgi:hypothetical protein
MFADSQLFIVRSNSVIIQRSLICYFSKAFFEALIFNNLDDGNDYGYNNNNNNNNNSILYYFFKVGCLHPVACTRSGSGFQSNTKLV